MTDMHYRYALQICITGVIKMVAPFL